MTALACALRTMAGWIVGSVVALGPTAGLALVAILAGALVIVIFRYTANQESLRAAKDAMHAALLGIVLFRHDTRVMFREEWRLVRGALVYMVGGLRPLAFVILPIMAIIAQLELFYAHHPLVVGEATVVTVHAAQGDTDAISGAHLEAPSGIEIETPALRIPARSEVCWRVKSTQPGAYTLAVHVGEDSYDKSLLVGLRANPVRLSPSRVRTGFWATLFDSAEAPLPSRAPLTRIDVAYAPTAVQIGPWHLHWMVPFLVVAMLVGLALKGPLRVEL